MRKSFLAVRGSGQSDGVTKLKKIKWIKFSFFSSVCKWFWLVAEKIS